MIANRSGQSMRARAGSRRRCPGRDLDCAAFAPLRHAARLGQAGDDASWQSSSPAYCPGSRVRALRSGEAMYSARGMMRDRARPAQDHLPSRGEIVLEKSCTPARALESRTRAEVDATARFVRPRCERAQRRVRRRRLRRGGAQCSPVSPDGARDPASSAGFGFGLGLRGSGPGFSASAGRGVGRVGRLGLSRFGQSALAAAPLRALRSDRPSRIRPGPATAARNPAAAACPPSAASRTSARGRAASRMRRPAQRAYATVRSSNRRRLALGGA